MKLIDTRHLAAAAAVLGLLCTARPGFSSGGWLPASSSPGKNSAYADTGQDLVPHTSFTANAGIVKGKKKSVLVIESTLALYPGASMSVSLAPTVNGSYAGVVYPAFVTHECASSCVVAATFWVDIDAAEAAHPGMFVKQPLNVVMTATPAASTAGMLNIAVRQEKK